MAGNEEVISVFRDPSMKLHTTRSWDFLDQQSGKDLGFKFQYHHTLASTDVIIGMIDTGTYHTFN